jgi:hypothetical protein
MIKTTAGGTVAPEQLSELLHGKKIPVCDYVRCPADSKQIEIYCEKNGKPMMVGICDIVGDEMTLSQITCTCAASGNNCTICENTRLLGVNSPFGQMIATMAISMGVYLGIPIKKMDREDSQMLEGIAIASMLRLMLETKKEE